MVDEEEAGGVRAVQAWATGATERAAHLIGRGDENHPLSAEEFEGSIAELSRLRHLLDHDRFLLGRVTLVLGVLHAKRHLTEHGTPADPERARHLLDEVRDPATAAGELMTDEGRQWAAMFLLVASHPTQPGHPAAGSSPDMWTLLDGALAKDPAQNAAEAARVAALAAEIGRLPMLPPELQGRLQQAQDIWSYVEQSDLSDPGGLMAMLPPDFPLRDQLQTLLGLLPQDPDPSAPRTPSTSGPAPEPEPEPEDQDDITVTNAWFSTLLGLSDAMRTGDPESVNQLLQRLGGQLDSLPAGHGRASEIQNLMRMVLQAAAPLGGSRVDSVESLRHIGSVVDHFAQRGTADPGEAHLAVAARAAGLFARMRAAEEMEDEGEFLRLMGELDALEASVPADHPFRWMVMLLHGSGLVGLGALTRDDETVLRGLDRQEAALKARPKDDAAFPTAQLAAVIEGMQASRAALSRTPDLLPRPDPPAPGAPTSTWYLAAMTAGLRYSTSQDPADLDAAISGLEHVRDELRQGRSQLVAFPALWQLAEYYRMRLRRTRDPADEDAATDAAMESLQALAGDVVLQSGPDHGLLTARTGAERGVQAAIWAASQGRVEEAVAALELGRALVLQAASASRAVPELLEARGHHGLAQEWRAAAPAPEAPAPGAGAVPEALPRELPSSLRRRALEALGHRERDGALFRTPTVDELKAGLAEGDADALVYLLAGEGGTPGMAVVLGPDMGTGVRALPLLSGEKSGPLERFLDASAAYQVRPPAPGAAQTWEDALSELCDWATDAVILPVISGVAERLAANENRRRDRPGGPRIVLVPCGRLGVVPWHAARLPAAAPSDYVCQIMVISYAASGRQFLNTVRRGRRAPADAPVLVADPTMSLPYAELEVVALQQTLYPRARLYGEFYEPPVAPAAAGTPNDLLAALAGGPSLLHVACHGSAGTNPTASALRLAPETDGPTDGPEGDRTTDLLTVARLLDHPAGEQNAPDGPLVVLSACETDLSKRDHDEALTLTSAFVANGARDVVGSRWATRDSAAALMMAVFHHYLTVEGLSPVDALHSAQCWMLDPERENPGSLGDSLLEELAGGPELAHPAVWAAFVHQGHPGPSRVRNRARSGS
ncbi:CHAT domain-containing protein [Streptomyces sp. ZAF1911]|uniref:CHAT domain-containing protein n=1 Tax=Streptomyces sp. ZAF1911 TaxID=2944129 RepID=UPI00237BA763|nr:CHAT domain-containing protein [Streptomyces sp. ZAF1911]MDD9376575.1 CHAT domain-containing protein [Streptomyces sp. ZAF1911]